MARKNNTPTAESFKTCSKCQIEKPLNDFRLNKRWRRRECRDCEHIYNRTYGAARRAGRTQEQVIADKEYQKRYKAKNRARLTDWERDWRKNNKDKANARTKRYYDSHKSARLKWHARHYVLNRERIGERNRRWRANNSDKLALQEHRRRAREMNAPVNDFTTHQWEELLATFNGHCAYCLRTFDSLEIEHVIPISRNGSNTQSNIVPACRGCNSKKGRKTLLEFLMVYGPNPVI